MIGMRVPQRVLVVKLADIGDGLLALPALRALHTHLPDTEIDLLAAPGAAKALAHEASLSRIVVAPPALVSLNRGTLRTVGAVARSLAALRARRYDAVLFFHHLTTEAGAARVRAIAQATGAPVSAGLDNGRGGFLTHRASDHGFGFMPEWAYWLSVVALFGAHTDAPDATYPVPASARAAAAALTGDVPYVVLHPGVGPYSVARQWPLDRLAAVGRSLGMGGYRIVVTGGTDAAARADASHLCDLLGDILVLDLTGKTDIAVSAAVLAGAVLFVGSDNGMAHLAAAVGVPSVVVFGPSNARAWGPFGAVECHPGTLDVPPDTRVVVLRSTIACSPCFYIGHSLGRPEGCAARDCLRDIGATDVLLVAAQLIAGRVQ